MRRIMIVTSAPHLHRGYTVIGGDAAETHLRYEAKTIDSPEGREQRMRDIQDRDPTLMSLEISEVRPCS